MSLTTLSFGDITGFRIVVSVYYSLGLISDSFHMFFDCTALLAGLVASVIARWRTNEAYSYGSVFCMSAFVCDVADRSSLTCFLLIAFAVLINIILQVKYHVWWTEIVF